MSIDAEEIATIKLEDIDFLCYVLVNSFKAIELEIFIYGKTDDFERRIDLTSKILSKGLS